MTHDFKTILHEAIQKNDIAKADEILKKNDLSALKKVLFESLKLAIRSERSEMIELLVKHGAPLTKKDFFFEENLLTILSESRRWAIILTILRAKALDQNDNYNYFLFFQNAILSDQQEVVSAALQAGMSPDRGYWITETKHRYPLDVAIDSHNPAMVALILQYSADTLTKGGLPPIKIAAQQGSWKVVKAIADTVKTDQEDKAAYAEALHLAIRVNNKAIVTALIEANTPIYKKIGLIKCTALDVAINCGNYELIDLFKDPLIIALQQRIDSMVKRINACVTPSQVLALQNELLAVGNAQEYNLTDVYHAKHFSQLLIKFAKCQLLLLTIQEHAVLSQTELQQFLDIKRHWQLPVATASMSLYHEYKKAIDCNDKVKREALREQAIKMKLGVISNLQPWSHLTRCPVFIAKQTISYPTPVLANPCTATGEAEESAELAPVVASKPIHVEAIVMSSPVEAQPSARAVSGFFNAVMPVSALPIEVDATIALEQPSVASAAKR